MKPDCKLGYLDWTLLLLAICSCIMISRSMICLRDDTCPMARPDNLLLITWYTIVLFLSSTLFILFRYLHSDDVNDTIGLIMGCLLVFYIVSLLSFWFVSVTNIINEIDAPAVGFGIVFGPPFFIVNLLIGLVLLSPISFLCKSN